MSKKNTIKALGDSMKDKNLTDKLEVLAKHGIPVFVAGPPGIGKSARISKVLNDNFDFVREERPSQWDPIDARGVPVVRRQLEEMESRLKLIKFKRDTAKERLEEIAEIVSNNAGTKELEEERERTLSAVEELTQDLNKELNKADSLLNSEVATEIQWPRLDFLPPEDYKGSVGIFFDELNTAPTAVQNVLLQPFQATPGQPRRIGPHSINGSNVWLVAAGNRPEDVAHVNPMGGPLRNRFHIITVEPDDKLLKDWTKWAMKNEINELVVGFLNFASEHFYEKPSGDFDAFPTPRSWSEQVSPLVSEGITGTSAFTGAVGRGAATAFNSYIQEVEKMPDVDKLIKEAKKGNVNLPDNLPLSIRYALMIKLLRMSLDDPKLIGPAMTIAAESRPEHTTIFVSGLISAGHDDRPEIHTAISSENSVMDWAKKHRMLLG